MIRVDRNDLAYWFPKLEATGIDMAVAEESFHWPGCPNSKQKAPPARSQQEAAAALFDPAPIPPP